MTLTELAQRLVELGKHASQGPWTDGGDIAISYHGSVVAERGLDYQFTGSRGNIAFIAAARDADKLAAQFLRAVEALGKIARHHRVCSDYEAAEDMSKIANAFLAEIAKDTP